MYVYVLYEYFILGYLIMLMCVGMCACMFSFFSFPFIFFRFGLFTFVALGNRGSPREVISVTCESSWLSRHTIIYIIFFLCIYFLCIFMVVLCGANIYFNFNSN